MAMFENFPYSDMHNLNLDWIIKIAKDFLDQYTSLQQTISDGETSLTNLTNSGLESLQEKADNLEELLQAWYDTHSSDIADQLADALESLSDYIDTADDELQALLTSTLSQFNTRAEAKAAETIASIPADYTQLASEVQELANGLCVKVVKDALINNSLVEKDMSSSVDEVYSYAVVEFELNSDILFELSGYNYRSTGTGQYHRSGYFFLDANDNIITKLITPDDAPFHTVVKSPHAATKLIVNGTVHQGENNIGDYRPRIIAYDYPIAKIYHNNCVMKTNGGIYNSVSNITNGEYYSFVEAVFIPDANNWFRIKGTDHQTGSIQYAGYTFYDETNTELAKYSADNDTFNDFVHAPATACKVVVNGRNNIKTGTLFAPVVEFIGQDNADYKIEGKKIVWFGTSIPDGAYENGFSYPEIVADRLGCVLYNESIGSSALSAFPDNICRVKNLAMTYNEKQVQSWWNDLSDSQKLQGRDSSFDYVLSKYLTGGSVGPVDIYVFDHVYNDYDPNNTADFDKKPANENDKNYPYSAAHFLIQTILSDNPQAIVLWIGHYEGKLDDNSNKQSRGLPVVALQKKICDDHQIPLCPVWEFTGWGNPHKVTTTGYWDNGIWHNDGGNSRLDYVKNCAFQDGIHPSSDASGKAIHKIANIITDWIRSFM